MEIEGLELTGGLNPTEVGAALQGQAGAGVRNVLLQQLQQRAARSESLPGAGGIRLHKGLQEGAP